MSPDERAADAHAQRVFDALTRARVSRGAAPPRLVLGIRGFREEVRRLRAGEADVQAVTARATQLASRSLERGVRGQAYVSMSLDVVPPGFDRVVLHPSGLFAVEVTAVRPPGAAWAQYVVLLLLID